jgi:hypothetical protein
VYEPVDLECAQDGRGFPGPQARGDRNLFEVTGSLLQGIPAPRGVAIKGDMRGYGPIDAQQRQHIIDGQDGLGVHLEQRVAAQR